MADEEFLVADEKFLVANQEFLVADEELFVADEETGPNLLRSRGYWGKLKKKAGRLTKMRPLASTSR